MQELDELDCMARTKGHGPWEPRARYGPVDLWWVLVSGQRQPSISEILQKLHERLAFHTGALSQFGLPPSPALEKRQQHY